MRKIAAASVAATALALTACGGGGGGGDIAISDITVPDVERDTAISLTGGSPPDLTRYEARSRLGSIIEAADVYDTWYKVVDEEEPEFNRAGGYHTDCDPDVCVNSEIGEYLHPDTRFTPIMVRNGIPMARMRYLYTWGDGSAETTYGYGGWMDHSAFAVELVLFERHYQGEYWLAAGSITGEATGHASRSNPEGTFNWNGVMVGRDSDLESSFAANVVQGDARASTELSGRGTMTVDVAFTNIRNLNSGDSLADMRWHGLPVTDGSFETREILGTFYGPEHEEVAGTFSRNQIIGAFGAQRD